MPNVDQLVENLHHQSLSEVVLLTDINLWANYLFSQDIIGAKCSARERERYINLAIACGHEYAASFLAENGRYFDLKKIIAQAGIDLKTLEFPSGAGLVLFGQFQPPQQISINYQALAEVGAVLQTVTPEPFAPELLVDLVLGHEYFHWLEEQVETEIVTRTTKIPLWRFLGWTHYSSLTILSEIAAMVFTYDINQAPFNPCVLDLAVVKK